VCKTKYKATLYENVATLPSGRDLNMLQDVGEICKYINTENFTVI